MDASVGEMGNLNPAEGVVNKFSAPDAFSDCFGQFCEVLGWHSMSDHMIDVKSLLSSGNMDTEDYYGIKMTSDSQT